MRFMSHNWSATKQHLLPQSVAEISHHSVLSGDRIRQCETSSGVPLNCPDAFLQPINNNTDKNVGNVTDHPLSVKIDHTNLQYLTLGQR